MSIFEKYPQLTDPEFVERYDLSACYTKLNPTGAIVDLDVAVALLQCDGNISDAAVNLGRSRRTLDSYIARDVNLSDLNEDIYDAFMDDAEGKLKALTRAGDGSMIRYVLGTKGKNRGYVTRVEATGKDGSELNVMFYLPENGRDPKPVADDGA